MSPSLAVSPHHHLSATTAAVRHALLSAQPAPHAPPGDRHQPLRDFERLLEVRVCVCACVCVHMHTCVYAHVRAHMPYVRTCENQVSTSCVRACVAKDAAEKLDRVQELPI